MEYDVEAERQVRLPYEPGGALLRREGPGSRDEFRGDRVGVLDGELHAAEPGRRQGRQPLLVQPDAAGDQLCMDARAVGRGDDLGEIAAQQRFASREMALDDAQVSGLPEHLGPLNRGQLL